MPHVIEPTDEWKETLAKNFSKLLQDEIGQFKTLEAAALNEAEPDEMVCHSHDFTDANMIMAEAFAADGFDTDDFALWNEVWDIAKKNGFFLY